MTQLFTAEVLRRGIVSSLEALRSSRGVIDAANVYPVPDSDTGTNLVATVERIVAELANASDQETSRALKAGALRGARGNSGVILAQILRAFADAVDGGAADADTLRLAFARATELAYEAVLHPVEGTILTVMRAASDAVRGGTGSVPDLLLAASNAAASALDHTTEQLPALRDAGVVDAGGMGLVVVLDALAAAAGTTQPAHALASANGLRVAQRESGSLEFALEVQYLLRARDEAIKQLRVDLGDIGDSVAVTGGDGLWRVHVHTNDEPAARALGSALGEISDVEVVRFADQIAAASASTAARAPETEDAIAAHTVPVATTDDAASLIAIASGAGASKLFADLGAHVVDGGDRMAPTLEQLCAAIAAARQSDVIVLPNNEDVYVQAKDIEVAGKRVTVLRTTDQVEGLAAAVGYGDARPAVLCVADMKAILSRVRTGAVVALPPESRGALGLGDDAFAGFAEGEAVGGADDPIKAAIDVVGSLATRDSELVTILAGADAASADEERLRAAVHHAVPGIEVEILEGGQPRHHYLIAVE